MDGYSGRKGADVLAVPKRGSCIVSGDSTSIKDRNIQLCKRIGCSGRLNPATAYSDKANVLKSSSPCSSNGKNIVGDSSKGAPKVAANPTKPSAAGSSASSGSTNSNVNNQKAKVPTSNPLSDGTSRSGQLDQKEAHSYGSSSTETGRPSAVLNGRTNGTSPKKPLSVVDSSIPTRTKHSGSSKSTPQLSRQNASATRPSSRYLTCSSVPDVAPSKSVSSTRKQTLKRSSERESSTSSRVKPTVVGRGNSSANSSQNGSSTRQAQGVQTSIRDNVSNSVRSRRPLQMTRRELPTGQHAQRLRNSQFATGYSHRPHGFTRLSTTGNSHGQNITRPAGVPYSINLVDREGLRHYNFSDFTEMFLALDWNESDEEMSYERLLALESNIGLRFHDRHRDMRLDIDNMTYEELLALEERMGSVSTALSEDALAKCIKKSAYRPCSSVACLSNLDGCVDDTKCSICQEEYNMGDEMGKLHCNHSYHVECINQWLWQRNWCPICKSSAAS